MIEPTGVFDFWTLLVELTFGGFWITVISLMLVMFIIMGWLGRISIFSCTLYLSTFLLSMTLGYGYASLNLFISLALIVAFVYSVKGYLDRGGQ